MIFGGRWLLTLLQSNIPSLTDNFIVIVVWILKVFLTIANGLFSFSTTRNHVLCDREIEYSWMRGLLSNAGSQKKFRQVIFLTQPESLFFIQIPRWKCRLRKMTLHEVALSSANINISTISSVHTIFIKINYFKLNWNVLIWFKYVRAQVPNVSASLCFSSAHLYFIYLYFREK